MKVGELIDKLEAVDLIDDCVKVIIRDEEFNVLAEATLPDSGIAFYRDYKVECFAYEFNSVIKNDELFINIASGTAN